MVCLVTAVIRIGFRSLEFENMNICDGNMTEHFQHECFRKPDQQPIKNT